jgi:hypothetical protein
MAQTEKNRGRPETGQTKGNRPPQEKGNEQNVNPGQRENTSGNQSKSGKNQGQSKRHSRDDQGIL